MVSSTVNHEKSDWRVWLFRVAGQKKETCFYRFKDNTAALRGMHNLEQEKREKHEQDKYAMNS